MRAELRSEWLKQSSTRTVLGLFAAMLGLVALAVLLHGFGVAAERYGSSDEQVTVLFGRGEFLAALFAGLLGALSVTSEIRHGTIRPTFLVSPSRSRVAAAKVCVSASIGAGFGLAASGLALGIGTAALNARGIDVRLAGGEYALLIAGSAGAGALWGTIGVGIGAVVRNQIPALVGICAWLLFVEGLLVGDVSAIAKVGRFAPGAAAAAMSGQGGAKLVAPAVGLAVLVGYAVAASLAGRVSTLRRDVA
jgi:ABC-type transport system involved in multi-copper enzyme maturation permease subunit